MNQDGAVFRGHGPLKDGHATIINFTTSSETVTEVTPRPGFTVGDFTSGVATLTFPKTYRDLVVLGFPNTDNATASSRQNLICRTISTSAGTATLRCVDGETGATEAIADGTYRLLIIAGLSSESA